MITNHIVPKSFYGLIGTAIKQIVFTEFDSISIDNFSTGGIYFSVDGGREYTYIGAAFSKSFDKLCYSQTLHVYADNPNSLVNIIVWNQSAERK